MRHSEQSGPVRRLPLFNVVLAHALVLLQILTPCTQAGDILRMGATTGAATTPTAGSGTSDAAAANAAAAAAAARQNAQDMLARNTLALQAVDAMQAAARAAAANANNAGANPNFPGQTLPDVPNGLGTGGLDFITATGALTPQQSIENARTIVTIQQQQQQAMLDWKTFNVGSQTTVKFDQSAGGESAGNWIAFNRITDPSGNPTQILGSIEAQGQVYIINQNGIIFGGSSVVNTHTLVASALPINDNLITRGLLNNPDSQFLFSANAQAAGTKGPTPAYTPPALPATGRIGNVTVQAGARITAPTSAANVGGRVALIGPNVTNNGTISTPDGQTILAAGMEVGFDAHSADDPSLRGLDVYVGDAGTYGGTATNAGLIEAPRGSIVITGKNVNQNGFLNSTTSVALNGRIDLLANYNAFSNPNYDASDATYGKPFLYRSAISTGVVSTAAGSVMQILPEWSSTTKVVGTELALKSQINMQGLAVYLGSDSVILAPNADVAISAGIWDTFIGGPVPLQDFVAASGQVYLDHGAVVNVAGSTAIASSLDEYIITVTLRAAELADSALQRNGTLRGQTITVDLREHGVREDGTEWVGTPLADLTGYLGVIERNVGQLTVAGGTVSISAGGSVIMQNGSSVDVSGGYLDYGAGYVQTSRLLHEGNLVDIADARADILYDSIYTPSTTSTDPRWATSNSSTSQFGSAGHMEDAHTVGANGGKVNISAASMALDGNLRGNTIVGAQQLEAAPQAASLELHFRAQQAVRTIPMLPYYSPTPPEIEFSNAPSALPAANAFALDSNGAPTALRAERQSRVVLSTSLLSSDGFGSLLVDNKDGNITVPTGVSLTAPTTGSITLQGANINVLGSIIAPAGSITLEAYNVSPYTSALLIAQGVGAIIPPASTTRGRVTIGATAVLSTRGQIVDERSTSTTRSMVPYEYKKVQADGTTDYISSTAGGSISIDSYTTETAAGSLLDVGGGFILDQNGGITYSDAGSAIIKAGHDPLLTALVGGHLTLGGSIQGFSGASGGSLTLQAPVIQVGGTAVHADALVLSSSFFNEGGFDTFRFIGLGINVTPPGGVETFLPGILITTGAEIRPQVRSLQANISTEGGPISLTTILQPEGYRPTTSLRFETPGITDFSTGLLSIRGGIVAQAGSFIETDALGSVIFNGQTVELLGSVVAPGGTIEVNGALHYPQNTAANIALTTVYLGAASRLSTAGKTVLLQDAFGQRRGHVYAGGSLLVSGNIVAAQGAVLDVSGTTAVLDLLLEEAGITSVFSADLSQTSLFPGTAVTSKPFIAQTVATQVDSNGGTLKLSGGDFLFSNATLLGLAGGSKASGGHLVVQSNRFIAPNTTDDDKDMTLIVAQDMANFSQPVFAAGSVIGQSLGVATTGIGYFGVNSFTHGAFDSLELKGNVEFRGPVDITAKAYLKVADGGVLAANDLVQLTAPYVALGRPLSTPTRDEELINPYIRSLSGVGESISYFGPTYGAGRLEVKADVIDTGFLSLQNIGQASLLARQDLRGAGYFDIAGRLTLTAGQIYPVTASTFTITAYDYTVGGVSTAGSVTIASSGVTPQFPLSGGGRLNIYASNITQGGTLRAPLGSIRLGWDGTGTAPTGLVTNTSVPITQQLTLAAGSVTSVSAIDPATGQGVRIPYGIVKDGTNWIDPTGFDITSAGAPDKSIRVAARNVTSEAGSSIDIRGGGELYGYRWVEGNGGTNDILDTTGSYAILPGFNSLFAPYSPYATSGLFVANLGGDKGYVNSLLSVGDQIYLKSAPGLAEGAYTLLPARYALLPGAMLVTPSSSGTLTTSQVKPGGALLTNGYRFNGLNPSVSGSIFEQFEVAPLSVVKARAEYEDNLAQVFIPAAQQRLSLSKTVTSLDAGYALLTAQQSMQLLGGLASAGASGGRGGRVDVSTTLDIVLAAPGASAQAGKLMLNTTLLSAWNAESLLIGGERVSGNGTSSVTVRAGNLTLDNAGAPLTGTEIVLVAQGTMTLASGSSIIQSGTQSTADNFVVSGNGTLVRVSGVEGASTLRSGVTTSALPLLTIGAGVTLSGESLTLDSSNATSLSPLAVLVGNTINLNSGKLSVLLDNPGTLQSNPGLVLSGSLLAGLQTANSLSLLSYTSLDLYGTGTLATAGALALHAGEIRGFNQAAGTLNITAKSLLLDNLASGTVVGAVNGLSGSVLNLTADTITIGVNALAVNQFSTVVMNAANGLVMQGAGSFRTQGDLNVVSPFVIAVSSANQTLAASGVLSMTRPSGPLVLPTSLGLGGQVSFEGSRINAGTDILLPSGLVSLRALTGDVNVSGKIYAGGVGRVFFDAVRYTDAGQVSLTADAGNVNLAAGGEVNVSAASGGGDAGVLAVSATAGQFLLNGAVIGQAGVGGQTGSVDLDVGSIASFSTLNNTLNNGAFTNERSIRIRNGDVTIDGTVNAHRFMLSLDRGSITVNGVINATGQAASQLTTSGYINTAGANTSVKTSGAIALIANGSVTLNSGAVLTVAALDFDTAGKGGSISLEAGAQRDGVVGTGRVNVQTGSTLNLSVASKVAGSATTVGSSAFQGKFSGTLHIRAPQNSTFTDMLVNPVNGTILDASSIILEGYRLYDYNQSNVIIRAGTIAIGGETITTTTLQTNAASFFGTSNVNYNAMFTRLLANNTGLQSIAVITPGIEISNRGGSISLGTATSSAMSDWDLAGFRYGPKSAPGVLTLRAKGNLEFYNTLSDGFNVSAASSTILVEKMWTAPLMAQNSLLPVNAQTWSFRLAAGADMSAANFREVLALSNLAASTGSILLGKNASQAVPTSATSNPSPGADALTRLAINPTNNTATSGTVTASNRFQVIRTGSGDIEIFAGRDVQLLNQFATIYTAGTAVSNAANLYGTGDFVLPQLTPSTTRAPSQATLGAIQQNYTAQYSMAGGNVIVSAQGDIIHLTRDTSNNLIADSSRELPNNWLMRRGYIDPATGNYGTSGVFDTSLRSITDTSTSTSWWINFSNFFDGVGALGGGNVTLLAGRDVQNVSAHTPTNARAASGTPSNDKLLELGGGDVVVKAGRNIDGGVYYVERGMGTLYAGNTITTNSTRSPSLGRLAGGLAVLDEKTWMPTTLFMGQSTFDVSARGNVLLGPVANTFLLPQGVNNKHWYKTYFSTYSQASALNVSSVSGSITFRQAVTLGTATDSVPMLAAWLTTQLQLSAGSSAFYQPWLRTLETSMVPFNTFATLMPASLTATAFSSSINVVGQMSLTPSSTGGLELLAAGAINGLLPTGVSSTIQPGSSTTVWASSTINLSDANPASIPGKLSPYAYYTVVGNSNSAALQTNALFLNFINAYFKETGSTTGVNAVVQTKQGLHAAGILHTGDTNPVRIYAAGGDLSGLTLYSAKAAQVLAQRDISDIALYIQNVSNNDVSIVSAGRDIVAYNANSVLRSQASASGNLPAASETPKSGDIQISGPGSLEVLAGRDINLGTGSNNADGTGVGITSIGNGRNPYLPYSGADVVVGAGMGGIAVGLGGSKGKFDAFITALLKEIDPSLGTAPGVFNTRRYLSDLAVLLQRNGLGSLPESVLKYDAQNPTTTFEAGVTPTHPVVVGVGSTPDDKIYANTINLNDPSLTAEQRNQLGLALYFIALRDAGRDRNNPDSPDVNTYKAGYEAIQALFPVPAPQDLSSVPQNILAEIYQNTGPITIGDMVWQPGTRDSDTLYGIYQLQNSTRPIANYPYSGDLLTQARDIRTKSGGNISIFTPGGGLEMASTVIGDTLAPPGIITEAGGNISIFADQDISIGIARIFTLRGGDISIWSTAGDIAAGSSAKTVQSAPPTRVLIDPQSANVATDLAGLATGGGIGVLATVAGVPPGNVDLIAPIGAVDAGDAGIRATGNLNIAANVVLNSSNISVGGTASGTPATAAVASPALGGLASAASAGAATTAATKQTQPQSQTQQAAVDEKPSIISVEVLGYGGGDGDDDEKRRRNEPGE